MQWNNELWLQGVTAKERLGRRALFDGMKVIIAISVFQGADNQIHEVGPRVMSAFLVSYWYGTPLYSLIFQALPTHLPTCKSSHLTSGELRHIIFKTHEMIEEVLPIFRRRMIVFPTVVPPIPPGKRKLQVSRHYILCFSQKILVYKRLPFLEGSIIPEFKTQLLHDVIALILRQNIRPSSSYPGVHMYH